jgi:hypothetical protein
MAEVLTSEWREGFKARLREVVRFSGGQRQLARAWLGSAERAPQISGWCSATTGHVPSAYALAQLRASCGVALDWLIRGAEDWRLGSTEANPKPEWAPERSGTLKDDLLDYAQWLWDYHTGDTGRFEGLVATWAMSDYYGGLARNLTARIDAIGLERVRRIVRENAAKQLRGDALGFFEDVWLSTLGHAAVEALRVADEEDAEAYRREHAQSARRGARR